MKTMENYQFNTRHEQYTCVTGSSQSPIDPIKVTVPFYNTNTTNDESYELVCYCTSSTCCSLKQRTNIQFKEQGEDDVI